MPLHTARSIIAIGTMALALAGCSGRDTELSEKLAAIEAAAIRAEKAADRAEKAAKAVESSQAAEVAENEVPEEDESTADEPANQDPNSSAFQNGV